MRLLVFCFERVKRVFPGLCFFARAFFGMLFSSDLLACGYNRRSEGKGERGSYFSAGGQQLVMRVEASFCTVPNDGSGGDSFLSVGFPGQLCWRLRFATRCSVQTAVSVAAERTLRWTALSALSRVAGGDNGRGHARILNNERRHRNLQIAHRWAFLIGCQSVRLTGSLIHTLPACSNARAALRCSRLPYMCVRYLSAPSCVTSNEALSRTPRYSSLKHTCTIHQAKLL